MKNKLSADPTFCKICPIDLLLGAEESSKLIGLHNSSDGVIGQNTEYGCIIFQKTIKITSGVACNEEDKILTKFWKIVKVLLHEYISNVITIAIVLTTLIALWII